MDEKAENTPQDDPINTKQNGEPVDRSLAKAQTPTMSNLYNQGEVERNLNPLETTEQNSVSSKLDKTAIKERTIATLVDFMNNFNAALVNVLVSIPSALAITVSMNYKANPKQIVDPTLAVLTLTFGFFVSFLINGGTQLFKAFTATQAFILVLQVRKFGVICLPWTCLVVSVLTFMVVLLQIQKFIKITPNCILLGLKFATGIMLIVMELSHGFGIKDSIQGTTSLYTMIQHVFKHQKDVQVYVFFTFFCGTIILCYLLVKHPGMPWHAVFFVITIAAGIVATETNKESSLGESWSSNSKLSSSVKNQVNKRINEHFKHADMLLDPSFMIHCIVITGVTLLESSVTMRLGELILIKRSQKRLEIVGIAVSNFIAGVFGILPLSLPIGRNLLALRSGATKRYYLLLSCFLTVVFGWLIWPYMKYLPMITVSIFNASLGVMLLDTKTFHNYWKFSPKYALVFTLIIVSCFFIDLTFCMIFSWVIFLAIYMQTPSEETYEIGRVLDFEARLNRFEEKQTSRRAGRDEDEALVSIQKGNEAFLRDLGQRGVIYELRGRFNFLFYRTHVANIIHLDKQVVLLDFEKVLENDIEFISEYCSLIVKLRRIGLEVYVTGIPKERVEEDLFLRGSWVIELLEEGKVIFVS